MRTTVMVGQPVAVERRTVVLTIKLHHLWTANCFGSGGDGCRRARKKRTDYVRLVSAEIGARRTCKNIALVRNHNNITSE